MDGRASSTGSKSTRKKKSMETTPEEKIKLIDGRITEMGSWLLIVSGKARELGVSTNQIIQDRVRSEKKDLERLRKSYDELRKKEAKASADSLRATVASKHTELSKWVIEACGTMAAERSEGLEKEILALERDKAYKQKTPVQQALDRLMFVVHKHSVKTIAAPAVSDKEAKTSTSTVVAPTPFRPIAVPAAALGKGVTDGSFTETLSEGEFAFSEAGEILEVVGVESLPSDSTPVSSVGVGGEPPAEPLHASTETGGRATTRGTRTFGSGGMSRFSFSPLSSLTSAYPTSAFSSLASYPASGVGGTLPAGGVLDFSKTRTGAAPVAEVPSKDSHKVIQRPASAPPLPAGTVRDGLSSDGDESKAHLKAGKRDARDLDTGPSGGVPPRPASAPLPSVRPHSTTSKKSVPFYFLASYLSGRGGELPENVVSGGLLPDDDETDGSLYSHSHAPRSKRGYIDRFSRSVGAPRGEARCGGYPTHPGSTSVLSDARSSSLFSSPPPIYPKVLEADGDRNSLSCVTFLKFCLWPLAGAVGGGWTRTVSERTVTSSLCLCSGGCSCRIDA